MSISLSDASLKTYKQLLPASLAIMKKAEKHFATTYRLEAGISMFCVPKSLYEINQTKRGPCPGSSVRMNSRLCRMA